MINPFSAFNTQAVLIAAAVSLVAGLAGGWVVNGWRLNSKIESMVSDHALAVQAATEKVMAENARLQKEKDDALAKAQVQIKANAVAAAAARDERDRLRDDLTASRAVIPDATHASLSKYAETLSVVFEQCTKEYLSVAEKADGHAVDSELLFNAWTAMSKQ
jgi:hypothetical protein